MLTKILAAFVVASFVTRLLLRTKVRGLGRRSRSLIDIALIAMAVAYVVQVVFVAIRM